MRSIVAVIIDPPGFSVTESELCSRLNRAVSYMCGKCEELERKIEHCRRFTSGASDPLTIDGINRLIEDLQRIRASMHPAIAPSVE